MSELSTWDYSHPRIAGWVWRKKKRPDVRHVLQCTWSIITDKLNQKIWVNHQAFITSCVGRENARCNIEKLAIVSVLMEDDDIADNPTVMEKEKFNFDARQFVMSLSHADMGWGSLRGTVGRWVTNRSYQHTHLLINIIQQYGIHLFNPLSFLICDGFNIVENLLDLWDNNYFFKKFPPFEESNYLARLLVVLSVWTYYILS